MKPSREKAKRYVKLLSAIDRWCFWIRLRASGWGGRILNAGGVPGFVRAGQIYEFAGIKVRTRVGRFSTTISVNNVQVEFERLTGTISGIGICFPHELGNYFICNHSTVGTIDLLDQIVFVISWTSAGFSPVVVQSLEELV